jgi:hypothetical protein
MEHLTRRVDTVEIIVDTHIKEHSKFEMALAKNVEMTTQIAENTAELVLLFRGAKGIRALLLWLGPPVAILVAIWAWIKTH